MLRTRPFDPVIILTSLALVSLGLSLIYSANLVSYGPTIHLDHPLLRQLFFAVVGVIGSILIASLDYRILGHFAKPLYIFSILLLLFVLVGGHSEYGSRRWIALGGTLWQPSEIAKLSTAVLIAKYLSDRKDRMDSATTFFVSLGIAAVPAALVFVEPDLGTAVIFGAIWFGLILMSGARKRHLLIVGGLCLALLPFMVALAVNDYQRDRVALFIDPGKEPLERGFNILQAEISIGSGGLVGQGLTHGNQTQLSFLQTKSTDYIFSVLGEELGFVGAMVLFSLYMALMFRGIRTASRARDGFGRLLASGIVIMILAQVFINVGVNIRLFPVTGIPLPFISQGGTSLLSLFLGLGVLQSIAVRGATWRMASFENRFAA